MSADADWIVIRGTGTQIDGTWIERPFPWATRLRLGPGPPLAPTPGFEQDDEKGVAQVWEPERKPLSDILFKVETTYGASSPPPNPQPTLLGMPIVEAEPGTFPPGTEGDIVLGPPEDIVDMLMDDLEPPEDTGEPRPK